MRGFPALLLTGSLLAAADGPPASPGPKDKCPVCGMFVAKFPEWIAVVRFQDGSQAFFDGAKDLFAYLQEPRRYRSSSTPKDVASVWVKDYYRQQMIDARRACFVLGSNILGPMGKELVPCATEVEARTFLKDHAGTRILRFPEVTPEILKALQ